MASRPIVRRSAGNRQNRGKPNPCKVFVGNISYRVTFKELSEFFSGFGPVEGAQIVRDHQKQWSRGIGFVTFKSVESAQLALSASEDDLLLDGRVLRVSKPGKPKRQAMADELRGIEELEDNAGKVESMGDVESEGVGNVTGSGEDSGVSVANSLGESIKEENKHVSLNSDTLIHIFSYLHLKDWIKVERVCKSWCFAARLKWKMAKSLNFKGIFKSFSGKHSSLTDDILLSVLKRGCHGILNLDLSASPRGLTDFALDMIGMYCPKLEWLDLSGVPLTTTSLKLLTQRCCGLKWLRLAGCHQVGEKGLWWALHNCMSLESLDVTGNRRITGQCFYLAGLPPTPQNVKAKGEGGAEVKGLLKRLVLEDCCSIKDEGILLLSQHKIPVLEVVNISRCSLLSGAAVRSIVTIRLMPEVEYIEEETMARGAQIPWHIDRLDQQSATLDGRFDPLTFGAGVDIYILDSGIRYDHDEFESRSKYTGYDPTDVDLSTNQRGYDCHGHGTHVASLAAGKTYGVAKKAQVYSLRVLDCTNAGPWSVVLDSLDYVAGVIATRQRPAVVSMSLSGGYTRSVNEAVQDLYNRGIPIVVAAGNGFEDACRRSPASSPHVITVGGSARGDRIYGFTNFGQCVDIFAPGSVIEGADHRCPSCSKSISGTSMSTPMVSGVIAILLSRQPLLSPSEIRNTLLLLAGNNKLDFNSIPNNYRSLTPNKLLNCPGSCGGSFSADTPVTIKSPGNPPSNPGLYPPHLYCKWTITAAPGRRVQLDFTSFFTEQGYDVLQVCEGASCNAGTQLASLSGELSAQSRRHISRGGVMTIVMRTDGLTQLRGFQATVSSTGSAPTAPPSVEVTTPNIFSPPATTQPPTTTISTTTVPPTNASTFAPPTTIVDRCTTDNSQVPVILNDLLQEASVLIQKAVTDSLAGFLESRLVAGLEPSFPAQSCRHVAQVKAIRPELTSGMYWVRASNGSAVQVFCDLETTKCACDDTRGWMKVADVDMKDPSQNCPSGFKLWTSPVRSCGRVANSPGCSSTFLSTSGISYSRVCGRVIGYQYASPNAFYAHQYDPVITLDQYYVDGVSLTYGQSPRQHIWTYAAARSEVDLTGHICPCINSRNTLPTTAVPEFIGNSYFCDTGSSAAYQSGRFYDSDPLWDGSGCGPDNSCCDQMGTGYFCTDLGESTDQDIELRVCGNEDTDNEDVPIEVVKIYVQ